jgi:hypothetical protein
MNVYIRYRHNGDSLNWEFMKYTMYNCFLMSHVGWKTYFNFIYPSDAVCSSQISHYYEELFEIAYAFDFQQSDEIIHQCDKMAYLHQIQHMDDKPAIFLANGVAPHSPIEVDPDCVYFLKQAENQESRYATAYFNLGIYDAVYDDRVIIVPKQISQNVMTEMSRIQDAFQYNDKFMENICQYIIQTYAIVNGLDIKTLDEKMFVQSNPNLLWLLSGKTPMVQGA